MIKLQYPCDLGPDGALDPACPSARGPDGAASNGLDAGLGSHKKVILKIFLQFIISTI